VRQVAASSAPSATSRHISRSRLVAQLQAAFSMVQLELDDRPVLVVGDSVDSRNSLAYRRRNLIINRLIPKCVKLSEFSTKDPAGGITHRGVRTSYEFAAHWNGASEVHVALVHRRIIAIDDREIPAGMCLPDRSFVHEVEPAGGKNGCRGDQSIK